VWRERAHQRDSPRPAFSSGKQHTSLCPQSPRLTSLCCPHVTSHSLSHEPVINDPFFPRSLFSVTCPYLCAQLKRRLMLMTAPLLSSIADDEEVQLQPITLTKQHKGAIRAIRKVRVREKRAICTAKKREFPAEIDGQKGLLLLPAIFSVPRSSTSSLGGGSRRPSGRTT